MLIIPSILTHDPVEARTMLTKAEGVVKRIQVDIVDGVYANNKTIEPSLFEQAETRLLIDYHLMVREPINWLEKCLRGQADRVIGQVEMMQSQEAFIAKAVGLGVKVGLALDLTTPISAIEDHVFTDIDTVLVMSVSAGFGGQEFSDGSLDKMHELVALKQANNYAFAICDDGGISLEYIDDVRRVGVDEVAIGRRIFEGDMQETINKYLEAAYK